MPPLPPPLLQLTLLDSVHSNKPSGAGEQSIRSKIVFVTGGQSRVFVITSYCAAREPPPSLERPSPSVVFTLPGDGQRWDDGLFYIRMNILYCGKYEDTNPPVARTRKISAAFDDTRCTLSRSPFSNRFSNILSPFSRIFHLRAFRTRILAG